MALTTGPVVSGQRGRRRPVRWSKQSFVAPSPLQHVSTPAPLRPGVPGERLARQKQGYRGWGRRYAARLLVTDFLALVLASALALVIRMPSVTPEAAIDQFSASYIALTAGLLRHLDAGADLVRQPRPEVHRVRGTGVQAHHSRHLRGVRRHGDRLVPVQARDLPRIPAGDDAGRSGRAAPDSVRLAALAAPQAGRGGVPVAGARGRQRAHRHRTAARPPPGPAGRLPGHRRLPEPEHEGGRRRRWPAARASTASRSWAAWTTSPTWCAAPAPTPSR